MNQVSLKFFSNLRELTGPAKEIFARQLQAAYDLARLNESKGQGLSDRELSQNLEAIGYGENTAKGALRKINIAVDRYELGVEARRAGIVNGLQGDEDYRGSLANSRFGIRFNDLVNQEMEGNEVLRNQLELARAGDTSMNTPEPDIQPDIPTIDKFNKDLREANPDREFTDEELLEEYYETFPSQRPE